MFFTCQFAKVTTHCKMLSNVAGMLISPSVALYLLGCWDVSVPGAFTWNVTVPYQD